MTAFELCLVGRHEYFVLQVLRLYLLIENCNVAGFVPCIARVAASILIKQLLGAFIVRENEYS